MGDRLATIDMGRKVEAAVPLSVGAQQLPTFRPMSTVHVYIGFWTDHSCTETWVDENQLVRVESNNFVRVVRLRLIHITGFSVPRGSSVFQLFPSRHEPKLGRWLCPFSRGELGNHLTQCRLGRGIPLHQVQSLSMQPFGHNTWAELGGLCPFWGS